jgi:signal transduction histidine kinase
MDIYSRISKWKIYLGLAGIAILLASMWYTNYLATKLSEGERDKVAMLIQAYEEVNNNPDLNADISFESEIILNNRDIPLIATDLTDQIIWAKAFGAEKDTNIVFLAGELAKIKEDGIEPIINQSISGSYKIFYKQSHLLKLLTYFPLFQLLLLSAFVGIAFMGFSAAKRSEQNRVWAGMAKETAHQLGTPISAIIAWIEHLKEFSKGNAEHEEVVQELGKDVERLNLIADRFSKIGSAPKMESINIFEELEKCRAYMSRRASRKIEFDFPDPESPKLETKINPPLFDWVIENLLRNSLDAMEGEGKIAVKVTEEQEFVCLDISDTGKGIPQSKLKTVFRPGFTTKKRGWGLGLSLARRIIENYHSGKIFVKHSRLGEGTTFSIKLPK